MTKAVQFDEFGDRSVLHLTDVTLPEPGDTEVLVEIRAAGINPGEASIRQGYLEEMFHTEFPSGEGSDLAGVVRKVGAGVTQFRVGDEVLGWSDRRSSHAEQSLVPVDQLISKPAGVPWEVAGSLFVTGTTAWAAVEAVRAAKDDTVVVSAAAGGVGSVAVQLLVDRGATVIGLASTDNHRWLESVRATAVEYGSGLVDRVTAAAPNGVDAFLDFYGDGYVQLALEELGLPKDRVNTVIDFDAVKRYGVQAAGSQAAANTGTLELLTDLIVQGRLEIPIAQTFPLDQVQEAFAELEQRHTRGKIALIPG